MFLKGENSVAYKYCKYGGVLRKFFKANIIKPLLIKGYAFHEWKMSAKGIMEITVNLLCLW